MRRLEKLVAELPEAVRVDVEEWGNHPTFRVRGKNFVFCDQTATHLTVKLPRDEAEAVVATDPRVEPAGYGLGRSGWISVTLHERLDASRWHEIAEWVRTSYALLAPNALARLVIEGDNAARADSAASEPSAPGTTSRFRAGTPGRRRRRASDTSRRPR
jgi:predicted DNA-binding protein (MmcQ/YjbR family)